MERERGITVKAQVISLLMPKETLLLYSLIAADRIHVLQLQGQGLSTQFDRHSSKDSKLKLLGLP